MEVSYAEIMEGLEASLRLASNGLITCGGEQQWPGKSSNLIWLRYAQRVELAAEPPGGPARPVATITWQRVGRKSLDADTPHGG